MGRIITFSGVDGAGKSTQIDLLMTYLEDQQKSGCYIWTRIGYTPLFESLKRLLRRISRSKIVPPAENISPSQKTGLQKKEVLKIWLACSILELMWIYSIQLRWQRWHSDVVICDRYLWDSLIDMRVYFPQVSAESWLLWRLLIKVAPQPDAAFLLVLPLDIAVERMKAKNEPERSLEELQGRWQAYTQLSSEKRVWSVIDSNTAVLEIATAIQNCVRGLII